MNAFGQSPASNEIVVTVGGSGNLSGVWIGAPSRVTLQDNGNQLTGTAAGGGGGTLTFNLTQTGQSATTRSFSGTERYDGPGACSPAILPGTIVADLVSNTMTVVFSGTNADCHPETDSGTLHRQ